MMIFSSGFFSCISKSSNHSFKFATINFETERIENYSDGVLLPNLTQIVQHEKDAEIVLICQGSKMIDHCQTRFMLNFFFTFRSHKYCEFSW